jgi:protein-L-isoaspartate(D-aspartate) O-methyltransferase
MIYGTTSRGNKDNDSRNLQRNEMVARFLEAKGIKNRAVLDAFRKVPRHLFVPPAFSARAYDDDAVPIGSGQTISKPYIIAKMLEAANLGAGKIVLEIGAGSGYQAALLSLLCRHVYSLERIDSLSREAAKKLKDLGYLNVTVRTFDGTYGWSGMAPYDSIIVAAAAPSMPEKLMSQLGEGGILVCPVGNQKKQTLMAVQKNGEELEVREIEPCHFVPLIGKFGWQEK